MLSGGASCPPQAGVVCLFNCLSLFVCVFASLIVCLFLFVCLVG